MFERIGIVSKTHEPAVGDALERVLGVLRARGLGITVDAAGAALGASGDITVAEPHEMATHCDLIISIGGDGTLLQCAGAIYPHEVPVLGINLGRLGFLTDLPPDHIESDLGPILDGAYELEHRAVLGCEVMREDRVVTRADALNDIVVQKWNSARLITLDTFVDGKFLHSQRADGMIVATPTGSTAYALSGGGPIIEPGVAALALVPICPHTLTNRPIVVSDGARIDIRVGGSWDGGTRVTCDGNPVCDLEPGDRVVIARCEKPITLIHPRDHDHFATLRVKLDWGRDPC